MISGKTTVIAHLGYPTEAFKAPMIYNPWFDHAGIDAVVIPMGVKVDDYAAFLRPLFTMTNLRGALVTMPHKVSTVAMLDEVTPTARIAGACNAILKRPDGSLLGDMFDGAGFVRGVARKGKALAGARALVVGAGGVGSAIAASLAAAGIAGIGLFDAHGTAADALGNRLKEHYPKLAVRTGSNDPEGYDVVVNATPLGMKPGDPLPVDVAQDRAEHLRGRSRDEGGIHAVPARSDGEGLPDPGRYRHAVRADSRVPGVFRIQVDHPRATARAVADQVPVIAQRRAKKGVA